MQMLPDKPTPLAEMLSISVPYASALLKGDRPWTRALALSAYRKTGVKIGPIAEATEDEIDVLARFEPSLASSAEPAKSEAAAA